PLRLLVSLLSCRIRLRPRSTLLPYTTLFRSSLPATAVAMVASRLSGQGGLRTVSSSQGELFENQVPERLASELALAKKLGVRPVDRKSTRLNSSHVKISYAVFCLKKKKNRLL